MYAGFGAFLWKHAYLSSQFERGTISYMLTATMTKPTTISPTAQCHCKIKVIENINIARLQPPKPRTVSLEAIRKKSKSKRPAKRTVANAPTSPENDEHTTDAGPLCPSDEPQSPAPSDFSSASATSGSSVSWQVRSTSSIGGYTNSDTRRSSLAAAHGINASIELLRGGCLAGDILPLHIFVSHRKPIKSLQGVIITLYRLARVDTHPAIPLGLSREGKKPEYEDYYPKSRTGLGGLSLSSAGSSRSFRQDLNQVFAPLIVDPRSLTASVRSSIKVPEDIFPTISCVPGQMISFKYYVEVVVDLRGKLAGQERVLSQLGIVNGATGYGNGDPKVSGINGSSGLVFPLASGFGCLDTSQIRRERSVISWPFEIIVGTRDSERKRGKQTEDYPNLDVTRLSRPAITTRGLTGAATMGIHSGAQSGAAQDRPLSDMRIVGTENLHDSPQYTEVVQTISIPPPEPEEEVDEKTRLRRAEERLLPSEPPDGSYVSESVQASAPEAVDQEDFVDRYRLHQPLSTNSDSSPETIVPLSSAYSQVEDHGPNQSLPPSAGTGDNKRELEMHRLQMAASSPEEGEASSVPALATLPVPSAPVVDDDGQSCGVDQPYEFVAQEASPGHARSDIESLPVYRR